MGSVFKDSPPVAHSELCCKRFPLAGSGPGQLRAHAFTVFPPQTLLVALSFSRRVNWSPSSPTRFIKRNLSRNLAAVGLAARLCAPQPWEGSQCSRSAPPRARPSLGCRGHFRPPPCPALRSDLIWLWLQGVG